VILFIAPKNTGLKEFKSLADKYNNSKSKIVEVRGEDVPLFVSELVKQGKRAIGITGVSVVFLDFFAFAMTL